MLAACAELGLSFFFFFFEGGGGGGGGGVSWSPISSIYLFISSFFLFSFFLFQADGLILDETSQSAIKSRTTNPPVI